MSWNIYISEEFTNKEKTFFEIIQNFDSLGEIIFQERNILRKIIHPELGILAVKSFKKPHFINQIVYANFRKSKASRSYSHAKILNSKKINTPQPLAFFEERHMGKLIRSFYFSKYYNYDFTFRELIEKKELFPDRELILKEFTQFVFTIHENNILFKDLSPGNVLIKKEKNSYHFSLIDLNRMSFQSLSLNKRLQNFIRLSLTNEMIAIIGKEYAVCINKNKQIIINTLKIKNIAYIQKKERKKKIKKLLGKS